MKLKKDLIAQYIEDTQFLVPVGMASYSGLIRCNSTAAFIVDSLKEDTTEDKIVDRIFKEYDAPRERIAADVREVLDILRSMQALDEP